MKGQSVNYLGKVVLKDHFRAFIYGSDGTKKLVNSWDVFEKCMQSGLWFATQKEAQAFQRTKDETPKMPAKPKKTRKIEPKSIEKEQVVGVGDDLAFEVIEQSNSLS